MVAGGSTAVAQIDNKMRGEPFRAGCGSCCVVSQRLCARARQERARARTMPARARAVKYYVNGKEMGGCWWLHKWKQDVQGSNFGHCWWLHE